MNRLFPAIGGLLLLASGVPARSTQHIHPPAPSPDAFALARRTDEALRGRTQQARLSMTVRTPDWQRTLDLDTWYAAPGRTFIRITAPPKDAGTATLRLSSDMWNYLPQVERVIKVPPSLMLEPWMGSDFSNDDLVKESSLVDDYTHQIEGEQQVGGDSCYQLVATPKPGAPVVWGRLVVWVRTSDALPRREEYLRRACGAPQDACVRRHPQRRRPELPDAMDDDFGRQAKSRVSVGVSLDCVRPRDPRPDLHAAEPETCVLRDACSSSRWPGAMCGVIADARSSR